MYAVAFTSLFLIVVGAILDVSLDGGGSMAGTVLWIFGCVGVVVAAVGGSFGRAGRAR
jgi:hypothetical protein